MGVALPLPGRGGGISPHMKALLHCFLKSSLQILCPQGHHLGCNILCCRGAWGEQPHKINIRISTRASRNLGLNALRLRGGMGATQAPIYDDAVANLRSVCAEMEMKERVNQKRDSCKSSSSGSIRRRRGSSGCTAFCPSRPARMVCALAMTESGIPASRAT